MRERLSGPTAMCEPVPAGRAAARPGGGAELPELRIVALADLLLHEEAELGRVQRLAGRLERERVLRNPPMVGRLRSGKMLLLDGANRVNALHALGVPHVYVQVERYGNSRLRLEHWNHVIDEEALARLEACARDLPLVLREGRLDDTDSRTGNGYLASLVRPSGRALHLHAGLDPAARAHTLRRLTSLYKAAPGRFDRVSHGDLDGVRRDHGESAALIVFAAISKDDVKATAERGERLPSGITRFLVPRRALGFNLELTLLESPLPLAEKQRRLERLVAEKVATKRVRYYHEPTFVFDE